MNGLFYNWKPKENNLASSENQYMQTDPIIQPFLNCIIPSIPKHGMCVMFINSKQKYAFIALQKKINWFDKLW